MITQQKTFKILYDDGLEIPVKHAHKFDCYALDQRPGHVIINIEEVNNETSA